MVATVHQALHGYSDGHRLIASSLPIAGADARVMVVMSDLSGSGVKPEPEGYLTGYPLEDAGKYVIARTWAAPEMPRPGCVWTHSLLIDNADLAAITSPEGLLSAFRRPEGLLSGTEFAEPLAITDEAGGASDTLDERTSGIVESLYTRPDNIVLAEIQSAVADERLLTAIWMQQWPRLRRSFGFCTLSGIDRSARGATLDLQLVRPSDRQNRSKFPDSVIAPSTMTASELRSLIDDIEGRDTTRIREFLRKTGGDVDGGRRAMLPLCRLHTALFASGLPNLPVAVGAVADLDALGTRQARSVRILIARKALEQVDRLDDQVFDFVIDTLEQGARPNEKPFALTQVGPALWHRSPARFFASIDAGGVVGDAAEEALSFIPAVELVDGLKREPKLAWRVASSRPELMERADFWTAAEIDDEIAIGASHQSAGKVALALLAASRAGPARAIIERMSANELAAVLDASAASPVMMDWMRVLASDRERLAAVLASRRLTKRSMIVRAALVCGVDDVPNDYGEDPWLIAARGAFGDLAQGDDDFLAAFLMARALGDNSRSQAELIRISYTTLYRAFQHDRLPTDVARMIISRFDWGLWSGWDNCSRLRETVVARFIDRGLDPETFGRLTEDGALVRALIDEAAKTSRGRKYLNEVRKCLKDIQENGIRARADYIAGKVK